VVESRGGSGFAASLAAARRGDAPGQGVQVASIQSDNSPFKVVHDPGHPDADAQGNVKMPNIEPVVEMVDMISASRAYEAGVTAINSAKQMETRALDIGRA
jgi:flagellar basal-body rod protein FlgC